MPDACGKTKVIGQTLFLGASVVSVNMNLGWGDTASSMTVELIEDFQPVSCYKNNRPIDPFLPDVRSYTDNHYYDCCANATNYSDCPDDCYIDEVGEPYDSNRTDSEGRINPPKEKNVPGKIYYVWTSSGVVSKYWYQEDPGFFGAGTRVNPDGTLSDAKTNVYNLINVPVFFKFDNLTFTGIIKSWDRNFNNGKNFYKIEIESVGSLLRSSWMIVDGYAGAVFSYSPGATYGAPRNYTGENLNSVGTIQSGNIHNLFNVYGLLESLGPYGFGGSNKNDIGISYRRLIQGLKILTSSSNVGDLYWKSKNMFSPFGRILGKTMQKVDNNSYVTILPAFGSYAFGVIPPRYDYSGIPRVEFTLDLSELLIPPEDIRFDISGKAIKISDFIQSLVDKNGQQSYWVTGQSLIDQTNFLPYNIIKIKAVDRTQYSRPYQVAQTITNIQNAGYPITSSSDGQARNDEAKVRTIYFGGNQQRLYQVKNYRLAFNQNNYIWDPVNLRFIDFRRFDATEKDKVKVPLGISTRNPTLNLTITPNLYTRVLNTDETIRNVITDTFFYDNDTTWSDDLVESNDVSCIKKWRMRDFPIDPNTGTPVASGVPSSTPAGRSAYSIIGDYEVLLTNNGSPYLLPIDKLPKPNTSSAQDPTFGSTSLPQQPPTTPSSGNPTPTGIVNQSNRFIPLYKDVLSPFFGFKYERSIPISDSNIRGYIRPVWLDTWSGQICAAFDLIEAPPVNCGTMVSLYNKSVFGPGALSTPDTRNSVNADPAAELSSTPTTNNPQTIPPTSSGSSPTTTNSLGIRTDSSYEGLGFLITETEMRAAMSGPDSYTQYCQAKMPATKPDLYLMLLNCWKGKGVSIKSVVTPDLRQAVESDPAAELTSSPNHNIGAVGIAGGAGQPSKLNGAQSSKVANIDFSMMMQPGFIADLNIIVEFIAEIGRKYYGRQYMVKLPSVMSYRDQQYAGTSIPGYNGGRVFVYSGSGKMFYSYDPADGAWEEPGNYIDNSIIVGGPHWRTLSDEKGLIPPILGFNASDKIDYVRKAWCLLTALQKAQKLSELRKEADTLSTTLNSFSNLFNADRPLSTNLAQWTIRVRAYVDINVGEEPGTGNGEQGSNVKWITLNGSETEEYLRQHVFLTEEQFEAYKQFAAITRQAKAYYESMPSQIECGAEEELVESVETAKHPCTPGSLPSDRSIDDWYIDTGAHYPNPNVPCPIVSRNDTNYSSPAYNSKVTQVNALTNIYANDKSFLIPGIDYSKLDADGKNYTIVNTNPFTDAFGSGVCGGGKKLYMKASFDNNSNLAFGNPASLSDPRAIINIGKPIELSHTSLAYAQDPNKFVMPNVAAEDIAYYRNAYANGATAYTVPSRNGTTVLMGTGLPLSADEQNRLQYLEAKYLTPLVAKNLLITPGSTSNASADHRPLTPKAAQPFFAAIPLKSNKYTYGPWANYPDFSKSRVFDYVANASSIIENLTDNIDVKHNGDYVPWNYGGVSFLDQAVLYEIQSNENYQIIQEKGSIRIVGSPVFTVGGHFSEQLLNSLQSPYTVTRETVSVNDYPEPGTFFNDYNYIIVQLNDIDISAFAGYPIIQSLSVSVANDGITTSYNLGTYNPKHGLYNKERIEQNNKLSKDMMALNAKITSSNHQIQEQFRNQLYKMTTDQSRFGESKGSSQPTALFGNSPTELLIGQSRYFLPDPGSGSPPQYLNNLDSSNIASGLISRGFRHESWAGLFTADEVGAEITRDYSNKSAMSLDGIFSPISFYPTAFNATYSLSNFYSNQFLIKDSGEKQELRCVLCNNARVITDEYTDYSSSARTSTKVNYPCPACCRSRVSLIKGSGNPKDSVPRVIIDPLNTKSDINFYTLNPIVVSAGEFKNWNSPSNKPNQTDIINDKHSIRVVGRGENLIGPEYNLDTTRNLTYSNDILNPDYEAYDFELAKIRGTGIYPLNQRFFGFRGPMMLHGWGYDTDGYPVPNLYDEPEAIDNYGRYLRFELDSNGFNDLTKPGLYITPSPNSSNINLGDIITKRYEWKTNKWIKKSTPSKYFGVNWASKPNMWPVGPIDLRWDHDRRVWAGGGNGCGEEKLPPYIITNDTDSNTLVDYLDTKPKTSCPYKMVYITLEQDLTRPNNLYYYSNPTRGYIDDLEYKADPLPVGFRRLVYLIDRSGYTAPAGSRLYCKYNPDLGFYEPISKPTVITTGIIIGGQARIDLVYAKGRLSNSMPNSVVNFANPLSFYVAENSRGIFSYIDGAWTLTAVN